MGFAPSIEFQPRLRRGAGRHPVAERSLSSMHEEPPVDRCDEDALLGQADGATTADNLQAEARPLGSVRGAGVAAPQHLDGAVVALGNFDGVHLGHQAVIGRAIELARRSGVRSIIATFDPHPTVYFKPEGAPSRLTTLGQRRRLIRAAGADVMLVFQFDGAFSDVTPQDFVGTYLAGVGGVVTGANFAFGRGRSGDTRMLAELAAQQGAFCEAACPVLEGNEVVSSSRIREALRSGDCLTATRLLTRPFSLEGTLSRSPSSTRQRQSATVDVRDYVRLPPGRYAVRCRLPGGQVVDGHGRFAGSTVAIDMHAGDLGQEMEGLSVQLEVLDAER